MPVTRSTKVSLARAIGLELYTQHKWFSYWFEELMTCVRQYLPAPVCRSRATEETIRWIQTMRPSLDTPEKVTEERRRTMDFVRSGMLELGWIEENDSGISPKSFFQGRDEAFSQENQFLYLQMTKAFQDEMEEEGYDWIDISETYRYYDLDQDAGEGDFDLHELAFIHTIGYGWNQQDWTNRPLDWETYNVEYYVEEWEESTRAIETLELNQPLIMRNPDRIVVPPLADDDNETVVEEETKELDERAPRLTNRVVKLKVKIAKTKLKVALHKLRRPLAF